MTYSQILRRVANIRATLWCTVPIPNSDANAAFHYTIWIIVSVKSSLLCCTVERTHYSGSARNYQCGAECGTVPVLHCYKVLSVGLSSYLEAVSFWKCHKTHWNGSVVMDLQLLYFPVSSNAPSLPACAFIPAWKYSSTFIRLCKWVKSDGGHADLLQAHFIKSSCRAVSIPQWDLEWVVLFSKDVNVFFQMANGARHCLY